MGIIHVSIDTRPAIVDDVVAFNESITIAKIEQINVCAVLYGVEANIGERSFGFLFLSISSQ